MQIFAYFLQKSKIYFTNLHDSKNCCTFATQNIFKPMKKCFITFFCLALAVGAMAADVKIDKETCTITKDGKTYKLYGKVKIVDSFEDIKVKIVDSYEDADIKIVDAFEDSCGKVKIVEHFEDVKVKIVDSFEDIKVKIVNSFEGVKK